MLGRVVGRQAHAELDRVARLAARFDLRQEGADVGGQGGDEGLAGEDRQRRVARLRCGARGIADVAQVDHHAITRAPSHDRVPLRIAVTSHRRQPAYPAYMDSPTQASDRSSTGTGG
jgi:hypothetical protein